MNVSFIKFWVLLLVILFVWSCTKEQLHVNKEIPETFQRLIDLQNESFGFNAKSNADFSFPKLIENERGGFSIIGSYEERIFDQYIGEIINVSADGFLRGATRMTECDITGTPPFPECKISISLINVIRRNDNIYVCGAIEEDGATFTENKSSVYVKCFDENLIPQWTYFDLNSSTIAISIAISNDGGVIIGGSKLIPVPINGPGACSPSKQNYVLKLNNNGEKVWDQAFGNIWECGFSVPAANGRISFIKEEIDGKITAFEGFRIFNISVSGENISEFPINYNCDKISSISLPNTFLVEEDNNIIFLWSSDCERSGGFSIGQNYLSKINSQGELIWEKKILDMENSGGFTLTSIKKITKNSFIVCGADVKENSLNAYLARIDNPHLTDNVEVTWEQSFGGPLIEYAFDVLPTEDNGFLLLGIDESLSNEDNTIIGESSIYLIKTDCNGNVHN